MVAESTPVGRRWTPSRTTSPRRSGRGAHSKRAGGSEQGHVERARVAFDVGELGELQLALLAEGAREQRPELWRVNEGRRGGGCGAQGKRHGGGGGDGGGGGGGGGGSSLQGQRQMCWLRMLRREHLVGDRAPLSL